MVTDILINAFFFYGQFGIKQTDVSYAQMVVKSDRATVVLLM